MNRTDRLLAIVLELQRKGARRAEDLAATFETSKRTIYRDIQALCESGVPVVAQPGVGYSLVEGYFLPPVSFNVDEATMLLLGADSASQNFDAQYRDAAASAGRKIEAVLSEKLRGEVEYLRGNIADASRKGIDYGRQGARYVGDKATDVYGQTAQKAHELIDAGKGTLAAKREQLSAAIEAGKEAYAEEKGRGGAASAGLPAGDAGAVNGQPR